MSATSLAADRSLVAALKRISRMRRAAYARALAAETLAAHEKSQKRGELLKQLQELPSAGPFTTLGGKSPEQVYRDEMGK